MSLSIAISEMQDTFDAFQQGTQQQPEERSVDWFLLRATALGLAYLKRLDQLGCGDNPRSCETVYRSAAAQFKSAAMELVE